MKRTENARVVCYKPVLFAFNYQTEYVLFSRAACDNNILHSQNTA